MNSNIVLEARGLTRSFTGVRALSGVDFRLRAGEVHALMGQNGAGKSTLIKVLTGVYPADAGELTLSGQTIHPNSPAAAQRLGISTVYQEVNLCPNLSVAENVFAGRYPRKGAGGLWRIDWARMQVDARALLARLNLDIDVTRLLASYPVAVQQMVAIARALNSQTSVEAKVLILDEPTSSLDEQEVERLFVVLRQLRDEGMAILFVTHFFEQMYMISDRITVLRNGERVGEYLKAELPPAALITAMVGRELSAAAGRNEPTSSATGPALLEATGFGRRGMLNPVDVSLRRGEVVGVGGLLGSGRTELARLLFGLDRSDSGELHIDGQRVRLDNPAQAIRHGLGMCPEERKHDGIVADLSVRENIALALQARLGIWKYLSSARQKELADRFVEALGIKTADIDCPVALLSGGNQQKVVLARWLATEPRLLILDEPTRGIDVAAKQEIMNEILALARGGLAVLFISSEMDEVVRVADRIVVMRDRSKVGELPGNSSEQARVPPDRGRHMMRPGRLDTLLRHRLLWPVVTLGLLLAVNAVFNPGFWHLQWRDGHLYGSVIDILNRAAPLALVALGMTLVIATRGIDISVGATVAIAAAVAALMIGGDLVVKDGVPVHVSRFPMSVAIVAAISVAALCGLWNGVLVAKVGMQPIIATLILMVAGRGIAQLLTGGQIITVYYAPYFFLGNGFLLGLPFAVFIAAAVWVGLHLLMTRTALGLFIQAIGINPAAARLAGLHERLITICVYTFCGFAAGVAGLVISSNVKSADGNNAGMLMELDAILAVTLGGTALTGGRFSLAGSVLGALIIQTLTSTIYSIGVPPEINMVVKAAVVFVVMLMQSAEFRAALRGWFVRPMAGGTR